MATLVLTAVGGVIGGPVGAAIGGVLGQAVDARVLARKGRQGPRLAELAVQTSSYGTAIPPVFGTMRVAGTVIWATDLVEHRARSAGGKGQGATTHYSYTASFAVAVSSRAIAGVGRVWADGRLIRDAGGAFAVATGFRVHPGAEDQPVDPLIAAAEGAGLAPAHRGLAYVVFEDLALAEFGNRIPSLTFEVVADAAAPGVGAIAAEIGAGVLAGASGEGGPGLVLDGFVAGGDSARGVLEALAIASGAWFRADGARLAMVAGEGDGVGVVDAGVGAGVGDAPRRVRTIAPLDTLPVALSVRHHEPARDWQIGVQQARRAGPGRRVEQVEVAAAIPAARAKAMAAAMLLRAEAERTWRRVTLDVRGAAIAPGARVRIAGEAGLWRVVRTTLEAMVTVLELVPVAGVVPVLAASPGRAIVQHDVAPGETILAAFEMPAGGEPRTEPGVAIAAAGTGAGWRRAALLYSLDDGTTWTETGSTAARAVIGTLVAALGEAPATLVDRRGAIEVVLAHEAMGLTSADAAAIDAGANLALVGDELVQFEAARAVAPGRWRLSGLRRGVHATRAGAHPVGARFVLIEAAALATLAVPVSAIGGTVRVMASGAGDRDGGVVTSVALSGASILPPAPVAARVRWLGEGRAAIGWARRSRAGGRWVDAVDVPLGEERERYRVAVAQGGAVRVIECDAPELELAAAAGAVVSIRQVGTAGVSDALVVDL